MVKREGLVVSLLLHYCLVFYLLMMYLLYLLDRFSSRLDYFSFVYGMSIDNYIAFCLIMIDFRDMTLFDGGKRGCCRSIYSVPVYCIELYLNNYVFLTRYDIWGRGEDKAESRDEAPMGF